MSNSPERVFDFDDAEHRNQYLRSLGAENILPPLPRSKFVKIKASGRVLPWDQLLAEQPTLVECCDANGNTDPAAWMPDVESGELSDEEQRLLILKAQSQLFADADKMSGGFNSGIMDEEVKPQPVDYQDGAVPLAEISKLKNSLDALAAALE